MSSNWNWLASTRALQEKYFNQTFPITDPDELADYVVMNHSALVVELSEFMQEVGWKDWISDRGWVRRDAAVGELVDVAHFLANLLCALGVTDAEWQERYQRKQEVNRNRMRTGYDGVSNKCPKCRRALDDADTRCQVNVAGELAICQEG